MCFCLFVFFSPKSTKTHWQNVSLSFFNIMIAPDSLCVFVFLCFFRKTQKHIDPILLKVDCGRKFAILSISVWPKKFKCRRNMKSCTFKQKPHQNCSQFLLQEWREESFSSGYQKYYMVDWTFCWIAKKMEWGTHFHNLVWLDSEGSEGTTCCDKKQLLHLITKQNAA